MKLAITLLLLLAVGIVHCDKNDDFFGNAKIIQPDPCDIALAVNLKMILLDIKGQQLFNENGSSSIRLNFDFTFKQPSNLSRSCFKRGVKMLAYTDSDNKLHKFDELFFSETELGVQLDLPINSIQSYAQKTEQVITQDKNGFLNHLRLILNIGNTRLSLREYTINYRIYELANNSIEFSDVDVSFKNASSSVKING